MYTAYANSIPTPKPFPLRFKMVYTWADPSGLYHQEHNEYDLLARLDDSRDRVWIWP